MWAWLKGLFSGKGGGCIAPNASTSATLTPIGEPKISSRSFKNVRDIAKQSEDDSNACGMQQTADRQQQAQDAGLTTPLQVAAQLDSSEVTDQQLDAVQQQTPQLPGSAGRYIYSGGKAVGFANTVTRYQENRPLKPHVTPFETRLEAKIAEEEVAAMAAAAAAGSRPSSSDGTKKQLFNMGIAQEQHA